jgi:hypothetical protein
MIDHPNLAAALVAALADLTVVTKRRTADTGKYSYGYADIGDVVEDTRPTLAEHGLVALTPVHAYEGGHAVTVELLHVSGESKRFEPFDFPHGKDAQATGSMVTYHRRYALLAALGMATTDDDGASAVARPVTAAEPVDPRISQANAEAMIAKIEAAGLTVSEVVKLGTEGRTDDAYEVHKTEVRAVRAALENLTPAPGEEPAA